MAKATKNKRALTDKEREAVKTVKRLFRKIAERRERQEDERRRLDTPEGKASDPGGRKWMRKTEEVYDYIDALWKEAGIDASDPARVGFADWFPGHGKGGPRRGV